MQIERVPAKRADGKKAYVNAPPRIRASDLERARRANGEATAERNIGAILAVLAVIGVGLYLWGAW